MSRLKVFLVCVLIEVAGKVLQPILQPPEPLEDTIPEEW